MLQPLKFSSKAETSLTGTLGNVALISTNSRIGFGQGLLAASIAAFSQSADSMSLYSKKGENSLHPCEPSNNAISRTFNPRKLFFIGIETT